MQYTATKYEVFAGKSKIAQLYVGGPLNGNNELRIKQGMPRTEVIKKIITDCPTFAQSLGLTDDYLPKLF